MNDQLQLHAQTILDKLGILDEHNPLEDTKCKFLNRIRRNTSEFLDIYNRLQQVPHHEILAILNHDARNLITPIVGYAELLEMQSKDLTRQQQTLIKDIADHARGLASELDRWLAQIRAERQSLGDIN